MTNRNWKANDTALTGFLVIAIALIPVANSIAGPQWLRITIQVLAVLLIVAVSFVLLRNWRYRQKS